MMFKVKKEEPTKVGDIVKSGDKVTTSGFYTYVIHAVEGEYNNCVVVEKAKEGLFLSRGSTVPQLGTCNHEVRWKLFSTSPKL